MKSILITALTLCIALTACSSGSNPNPAPSTYSLSGTVTLSGTGLQGVTMTLNTSTTVTTDSNGNYSFTGLANGSYTVTPGKSGYTFSPVNSTQTVNGANVTDVNFTASTTTASDLAGTWNSTFPYGVFSGQTACSSTITSYFTLSLTQTGGSLSGSMYVLDTCNRSGTNSVTGSITGNNITLQWQDFDASCVRTVTGTGTFSASSMDLTLAAPAGTCGNGVNGISQTFTLATPVDVTGIWTVTGVVSGGGGGTYTMYLTQSGSSLSGTVTMKGYNGPISGSLTGDNISLTAADPDPACNGSAGTNTGTVSGNTMSGLWSSTAGGICGVETGTWTAAKATGGSASDYVGIWQGSQVVSSETRTTTLTLSSSLTGSLIIESSTTPATHNLTTPALVTNGTMSFSLPLSVEDAANAYGPPSDCAGWSVLCSGTLSSSKLTLNLWCSGLVCSGGGVTPYSWIDVMAKQ